MLDSLPSELGNTPINIQYPFLLLATSSAMAQRMGLPSGRGYAQLILILQNTKILSSIRLVSCVFVVMSTLLHTRLWPSLALASGTGTLGSGSDNGSNPLIGWLQCTDSLRSTWILQKWEACFFRIYLCCGCELSTLAGAVLSSRYGFFGVSELAYIFTNGV